MRPGQIVPYPTLRERPGKVAGLKRRSAPLLARPRPASGLIKRLQLIYVIACIMVVAISLAAIAGLP